MDDVTLVENSVVRVTDKNTGRRFASSFCGYDGEGNILIKPAYASNKTVVPLVGRYVSMYVVNKDGSAYLVRRPEIISSENGLVCVKNRGLRKLVEHRHSERVVVNEYSKVTFLNGHITTGHIADISETGIMFTSEYEDGQINETVKFKWLSMHDDLAHRPKAIIVRKDYIKGLYYYGCELLENYVDIRNLVATIEGKDYSVNLLKGR